VDTLNKGEIYKAVSPVGRSGRDFISLLRTVSIVKL
jgi:hypothetical protein